MSKAPVAQFFAAFGQGDLPGILDTFDPDVVLKAEGPGTVPWYGTYHGIDGVKAFLTALGSNVQTQQFDINTLIADGDTVVATGYLKHLIPATGRLFAGDWALVCTVRDGKISAYQFFENTAAAAAALTQA